MGKQTPDGAQNNSAEILPIYVDKVEVNPFDQDTVKRAAEGDDKAFAQLFLNTYRYCFSIVCKYLRNDEDMYDAIQDTYMKVYANLSRLKDFNAFLPWLAKIAHNSSKDILAKNTNSTVSFSNDDEAFLETDNTVNGFSREVVMDVTEVFSKLSPQDAELLTLMYYDGLKVSDIAKMKSVAATTIYSRVNAAKRRLKDLLKLKGIDKPIYGGNLIALVTTVLRNAIGTQILSAAVADEILHSVLKKDTKAGVVMSKILRKQRNAAVLRVASLIVVLVIFVTLITLGAYFIITNKSRPVNGNDTVSVGSGVTSENHSDFSDSSQNTSTDPKNSIQKPSENSSANSSSSNTTTSSSSTSASADSSQNTVSTGNSGEIGNTDDSSSNDSSTNDETSNSNNSLSSIVSSSGVPDATELGKAANLSHNTTYHKGRIAKDGNWLYYVTDSHKLCRVKVDGSKNETVMTANIDESLIVYNGWVYGLYNVNEYGGFIVRARTDGTKTEQIYDQRVYNLQIVGNYAYFLKGITTETCTYNRMELSTFEVEKLAGGNFLCDSHGSQVVLTDRYCFYVKFFENNKNTYHYAVYDISSGREKGVLGKTWIKDDPFRRFLAYESKIHIGNMYWNYDNFEKPHGSMFTDTEIMYYDPDNNTRYYKSIVSNATYEDHVTFGDGYVYCFVDNTVWRADIGGNNCVKLN